MPSAILSYIQSSPCKILSRTYVFSSINENTSLCSLRSTRRGKRQKVLAVSLFGPKENDLFDFDNTLKFLYEFLEDAQIVYPDWIVRIYHDASIGFNVICDIQCQYANVDFCDMTDHALIPQKAWRFIPSGDPLVDAMCSRDLDSPLTERERVAVNDWLSENKSFHIMRDHPHHDLTIMGGMWGFRPSLNARLSQILLTKLRNTTLMQMFTGSADQKFLHTEVWPLIKNDTLIHDSYYCDKYDVKTRPFPTKRPSLQNTNLFVGCVKPCNRFHHPFGPCPINCRPAQHQDWTYC